MKILVCFPLFEEKDVSCAKSSVANKVKRNYVGVWQLR